MDLDGLEKLMVANHGAVMEKLEGLEKGFAAQVIVCSKRIGAVETDVKVHDRLIQKSRGAMGVIGVIWAAILAIAAFIAPYFWR
jgi:hypothetical protein